jgi:ATP synthase subunit 6
MLSTTTQKIVEIVNNPLEQFQIVPLIPIRSGAIDISFTNSSLMMVLATGAFLTLCRLVLVEGQGHLIPNRWQALVEFFYSFIQDMVSSNVGERGQGYFPMVFVLFIFILVCNLIGMVPYSFTVTSHIIVTLVLSMTVYIGVTIILFREHGFHAFSLFVPAGAPFVLYSLLIGIELISNVMRVVSLAVRLFANLMSGHILLRVLLGFAWTMMMSGGIMLIVHLLPMGVVFILLFLETAVAMIQAYVFAILTCIYLNEALHLH